MRREAVSGCIRTSIGILKLRFTYIFYLPSRSTFENQIEIRMRSATGVMITYII